RRATSLRADADRQHGRRRCIARAASILLCNGVTRRNGRRPRRFLSYRCRATLETQRSSAAFSLYVTSTPAQRISLIGAPTDVGAGRRGASMGPEALRVAGLKSALERLNRNVIDRGNVSGPINPEGPRVAGYRHLPEVAAWCRAVHDAVYSALADGDVPILMGGDHSLAIGSIAGVARYCAERGIAPTVLWLDAHADYNDASSSPTGNLHGMPVAVITGHGPRELVELGPSVPIISPDRIVQIGIRSVDEVEKKLVVDSGMLVYDMRTIDEITMRVAVEQALDYVAHRGGHLHVTFDVDFLDPTIAPG